MIRAEDSRIPAQNAVHIPTGPAPITVTSRIASKSAAAPLSVMGGHREGGPVQSTQGSLHRARDAGERGRVLERVGAGLGGPQPLHQVQEVGRVVGLEGDHELLVIEAERIAGVQVYGRVLAA